MIRWESPLLRLVIAIEVALLLIATPSWASVLSVGDVPPSTIGKDLEGNKVDLSVYAGKAIIVTFWATWCPYCLKELPILEGVQKEAGKERMQVIAVNTESRDVFRRASRVMKDFKLLVAHDTRRSASKAFGVKGIPHMVIIGRNGRIFRVYRGYSESNLEAIVADINQAMAAPP